MIAMLVGAWVLGCAPLAPSEDVTPQLGTPVTSVDETPGAFVWATDGTEIFYAATMSSGAQALKAAKSDGTGARIVDGTKAGYGMVIAPPDGSSLYFTAADDTAGAQGRAVYEVLRPRRIDGLMLDMKSDVVAASPDDRHLGYWSTGTFRYFDTVDSSSIDLADGTPFLEPGATEGAFTFSPTGDAVLLLASDAVTIADPATKTVEMKALPPGIRLLPTWDANGPRILSNGGFAATPPYEIDNLTSGTTTVLPWHPPQSTDTAAAAWSRRGDKVAIWDESCIAGDGLFNCKTSLSELYVVDVATGAATRIARTTAGEGAVAFSPDGLRLAYETNRRLYVTDLP
jgi:hypothetical protein